MERCIMSRAWVYIQYISALAWYSVALRLSVELSLLVECLETRLALARVCCQRLQATIYHTMGREYLLGKLGIACHQIRWLILLNYIQHGRAKDAA